MSTSFTATVCCFCLWCLVIIDTSFNPFWGTSCSPKMWLTLFVRFFYRRFHLLLHRATSLQIRLHPETSCRHWESKFLARVLKSCKSMNMQEGRQHKDLDLIKPQTGKKKKKEHAASPLKKNFAALCPKEDCSRRVFQVPLWMSSCQFSLWHCANGARQKPKTITKLQVSDWLEKNKWSGKIY